MQALHLWSRFDILTILLRECVNIIWSGRLIWRNRPCRPVQPPLDSRRCSQRLPLRSVRALLLDLIERGFQHMGHVSVLIDGAKRLPRVSKRYLDRIIVPTVTMAQTGKSKIGSKRNPPEHRQSPRKDSRKP